MRESTIAAICPSPGATPQLAIVYQDQDGKYVLLDWISEDTFHLVTDPAAVLRLDVAQMKTTPDLLRWLEQTPEQREANSLRVSAQ